MFVLLGSEVLNQRVLRVGAMRDLVTCLVLVLDEVKHWK